MVVPESFVGTWVRRGIGVGDEDVAEPADVVWLQGREWFADVRAPRVAGSVGPATMELGARHEAFGGRCTWSPTLPDGSEDSGSMTWDHVVDLFGGFEGGDAGAVVRTSELTFEERGEFEFDGITFPFTEYWSTERCGDDSFALVLTAGDDDIPVGVVVVVGEERLMIVDDSVDGGPRGFAHDRLVDPDRWERVRSDIAEGARADRRFGSMTAVADSLHSARLRLVVGDSIVTPTHEWTVVENTLPIHGDVSLSKLHRNIPTVRSSS